MKLYQSKVDKDFEKMRDNLAENMATVNTAVRGVNDKLDKVDDTIVVMGRVQGLIADEREKIDTEIDKVTLKSAKDIQRIYDEQLTCAGRFGGRGESEFKTLKDFLLQRENVELEHKQKIETLTRIGERQKKWIGVLNQHKDGPLKDQLKQLEFITKFSDGQIKELQSDKVTTDEAFMTQLSELTDKQKEGFTEKENQL